MSISLEFPPLDFWSVFCFTDKGQNTPITLEIIQKTDEAFRLISPQTQCQNNDSSFIGDHKTLKELGFFEELAFLDNLENKTPIEEKPVIKTSHVIGYGKQDEEIANDFNTNTEQIIANSHENGQNSNSFTKRTSPIRRSKRIAARTLNIKSSSSSREILYKRPSAILTRNPS